MYYFHVENHDSLKVAVIELNKEELGGTQAMEFYQIINGFKDDKINEIHVDFKNVYLMNSSGLGMLASSYRELKDTDSKIVLINVPEKIMKLLKLTQLDKIFNFG